MMKGKPVNEIFYSLQGEGYYTGRAAIFIRFSGCNLRCPFCDTDHSKSTMMSDEDILAAIDSYPSDFVVLTGGEPALFVDDKLVELLHKKGKYVAIETNGTRLLPLSIDWITLSPKMDFCPHADVVISRCDELKVVYTGQPLDHYLSVNASHYYLQPCDMEDKEKNDRNIQQCIDYCLSHPQWNLSLQTHKLLGFK